MSEQRGAQARLRYPCSVWPRGLDGGRDRCRKRGLRLGQRTASPESTALSVLDYDLTGDFEPYTPPQPFDENTWSFSESHVHQPELLGWIDWCRTRVRQTLDTRTDEMALRPLPHTHRYAGTLFGVIVDSPTTTHPRACHADPPVPHCRRRQAKASRRPRDRRSGAPSAVTGGAPGWSTSASGHRMLGERPLPSGPAGGRLQLCVQDGLISDLSSSTCSSRPDDRRLIGVMRRRPDDSSERMTSPVVRAPDDSGRCHPYAAPITVGSWHLGGP
jgi:hypothetical protein